VVKDGYIYVFYVRVTNPTIYYISSSNGTNWSTPQSIHPTPDTCEGAVNAFVDPYNQIKLYYSSSGGELRIRMSTPSAGVANFGPYSWYYDDYYEGGEEMIRTNTGVSVVWVPDGSGYREWIAYKSPDGGRLNIFKNGIGPFGNVYWTNAYTSNNPSMVYFDNKFTIVYKSLSSGAILRGTSTDGMTWSSNYAAIGQTAAGGPRLIAE
jgi:hypothetical protein